MAKINPFQISALFVFGSSCYCKSTLSTQYLKYNLTGFVSRSGMETHSKVLRQTIICRGQLEFKENTGKANWLETENMRTRGDGKLEEGRKKKKN